MSWPRSTYQLLNNGRSGTLHKFALTGSVVIIRDCKDETAVACTAEDDSLYL